GQRAPNCNLIQISTGDKTTLHQEFVLDGRFNILLFSGNDTNQTILNSINTLRNDILKKYIPVNSNINELFQLRIIIREGQPFSANSENVVCVYLDGQGDRQGDEQQDEQGDKIYSIIGTGVLIVVRLDTRIGCSVELKDYACLDDYFNGFVIRDV